MGVRQRVIGALVIAGASGAVLAVSIGSAGAAPAPVTIGSTSGTPSMNEASCSLGITCTFVPFDNVNAPSLVVPADGTVTNFSINVGVAGIPVKLRVLRPAAGGQFTGAGSSPTETSTATGVNTFAVTLPVKAGDVLGLDNATSAILFDTTSTQPIDAYYKLPSLADGTTAAPNSPAHVGMRLLLSATVQPADTTTTTTTSSSSTTTAPTTTSVTTTTTQTSTTTVTGATGRGPVISGAGETAATWRASGRKSRHRPPLGTTLTFTLSEPANVTITFLSPGRGRCAGKRCTIARVRGTIHSARGKGLNRVAVNGRRPRLRPGPYTALITATDSAGRSSNAAVLQFVVVR